MAKKATATKAPPTEVYDPSRCGVSGKCRLCDQLPEVSAWISKCLADTFAQGLPQYPIATLARRAAKAWGETISNSMLARHLNLGHDPNWKLWDDEAKG